MPQLPIGPVQTGVPILANIAVDELSEGCDSPIVHIVRPILGERVNGIFDVLGSATLHNFEYYKIEIRADNATTYNFYLRSEEPIADGKLGEIDTEIFGIGIFWIRLVVVDNTGNVPHNATCVIPVLFE